MVTDLIVRCLIDTISMGVRRMVTNETTVAIIGGAATDSTSGHDIMRAIIDVAIAIVALREDIPPARCSLIERADTSQARYSAIVRGDNRRVPCSAIARTTSRIGETSAQTKFNHETVTVAARRAGVRI